MFFEEDYMVVLEVKDIGSHMIKLKSPVSGLILHEGVRKSLNVLRFKRGDKVRVKWKMYFPGRNKSPSFRIDGIEKI